MRSKEHCLGEIIESSLTGWKAQAWQWDVVPAYGSLVSIQAGNREIFGVVHDIQTGSFDVGRTPFAYQQTEEELKASQPQIFEFIKTYFSCLTVGYREGDQVQYSFAPEPPKIHAFVGMVSSENAQQFLRTPHYLDLIFSQENQINAVDELLLAMVSKISRQEAELTEFVRTFSLLTGNDYRRLKRFLGRLV